MTQIDADALDALIAAVEAGDARFDATVIADDDCQLHIVGAFRGSFDAFLTLLEVLLPGWKWGAHEPKPGIFRVYVCPWSALRPMPSTEESAIASRAGLLALIKAYRAQVAG